MFSAREIKISRESPPPLQSLTICRVAEMLQGLNQQPIVRNFPWLKKRNNPFLAIPPEIIEAICKELASLIGFDVVIQRELFKILFCKKLQNIDLTEIILLSHDYVKVLDVIEKSKSNLISFRIISRKTSEYYIEFNKTARGMFARKLEGCLLRSTSLTHLMISDVCDDQMLNTIGANCPNLIILEAASEYITNEGLRMLCMDARNDNRRRCQNLQKIYLSPAIDDDGMNGIKALLLCLPNLYTVENVYCVGTILERIHKESPSITLNLREFMYDRNFFPFDTSVLSKICPLITNIDLIDFETEDLSGIVELSNLRKIIFQNAYGGSFLSLIAPFLRDFGEKLESLCLYGFKDVFFPLIARCCPNLRTLMCHKITVHNDIYFSNFTFSKLECLNVKLKYDDELDPQIFVEILSNCVNLHFLNVTFCENFNMEHIKQIWKRNPLRNLNSIFISSKEFILQGENISADVLKKYLSI